MKALMVSVLLVLVSFSLAGQAETKVADPKVRPVVKEMVNSATFCTAIFDLTIGDYSTKGDTFGKYFLDFGDGKPLGPVSSKSLAGFLQDMRAAGWILVSTTEPMTSGRLLMIFKKE